MFFKKLEAFICDILEIQTIHNFTNLNKAQMIEKFDWMTQKSLRFNKCKAKYPDSKHLFLHVVITLGYDYVSE